MISLYNLNAFRIQHPNMPDRGDDCVGWFIFEHGGAVLRCLATAGEGWDHVSVSLEDRCPTWEEMCFVKDTFFKPAETVVQYHPAHDDYVNCHPFCLHLWRPLYQNMPKPPPALVGPVSAMGKVA